MTTLDLKVASRFANSDLALLKSLQQEIQSKVPFKINVNMSRRLTDNLIQIRATFRTTLKNGRPLSDTVKSGYTTTSKAVDQVVEQLLEFVHNN